MSETRRPTALRARLPAAGRTTPPWQSSSRRTLERRREAIAGYLFLSPALLLFLVFFVGPLIAAIALSFYRWDVLTPAQFAGGENYHRLLGDPMVRQALVNTFAFAFMTIVLHFVLALGLALAVNGVASRLLKYVLRTTIFFPVLISWAAGSLIWKYVLDPNFGFVNYYLRELGLSLPNWFVSSTWALPSLVMIDLWKTLGFTFVILLAGLQTVPAHLYEAALVDGARPLRRFWHVTLPMLSPTLLFAGVISFIGAFQIFEPMFIITQGGPGTSTLSIVQLVYYKAFRDFEMGYACAVALLIAAIIMAVTMIQLRLSRLWVHYDR